MTKTPISADGKTGHSAETFDATGGPAERDGKNPGHHSKPKKLKKRKKGKGECSDAMDRWLNEDRKDGPLNPLL